MSSASDRERVGEHVGIVMRRDKGTHVEVRRIIPWDFATFDDMVAAAETGNYETEAELRAAISKPGHAIELRKERKA